MDKVETLFGEVPFHKIGTYNVESVDKTMDVFAAKISRGKNTDKTIAMMFVKHGAENPSIARLQDLQWTHFQVRSYGNMNSLIAATRHLDKKNEIASLKPVKLPKVRWGNDYDLVLKAQSSNKKYTTYKCESGFDCKVSMFVAAEDDRGNDLENIIELIPILQSYNFAIERV